MRPFEDLIEARFYFYVLLADQQHSRPLQVSFLYRFKDGSVRRVTFDRSTVIIHQEGLV
jgi:hypothetical protein